MKVVIKCVTLLMFLATAFSGMLNDDKDNDTDIHNKSEVLSRKKRFLIFPEGSSVQLVFCTTYPVLTSIGDIFLWGYTAALAYELPQDPYSPFNHHADPLHRRVDTKTIYFTDEDGKIIYNKPYKKKFIVNPAFAKRSVDGTSSVKTRQFKKGTLEKFKIDRKQMHASKHKREFLKSEHMDERSVEFHRSSRALLYRKIETILQGLGGKGRQCMLKTLCLVGQTQEHPQGPFFQEILRAVFTLPEGKSKNLEDIEYDAALLPSSESCDALYPDCDETPSDPSSPTSSY